MTMQTLDFYKFLNMIYFILQLTLSLFLTCLSLFGLGYGTWKGHSLSDMYFAGNSSLLTVAFVILFINEGYQVGAIRIREMNVKTDIVDKGYARTGNYSNFNLLRTIKFSKLKTFRKSAQPPFRKKN